MRSLATGHSSVFGTPTTHMAMHAPVRARITTAVVRSSAHFQPLSISSVNDSSRIVVVGSKARQTPRLFLGVQGGCLLPAKFR